MLPRLSSAGAFDAVATWPGTAYSGSPSGDSSAGGVAALISLWAFVELYCLRGTVGDNRYGPDPLAGRT